VTASGERIISLRFWKENIGVWGFGKHGVRGGGEGEDSAMTLGKRGQGG